MDSDIKKSIKIHDPTTSTSNYVLIEMAISKKQLEFIKAYAKFVKKDPESLLYRLIVKGIGELTGSVKALRFTNIEKFMAVVATIPETDLTIQDKETRDKTRSQ